MPCHGQLRRPLWSIIKSIGAPLQHEQNSHGIAWLPAVTRSHTQQRDQHTAVAPAPTPEAAYRRSLDIHADPVQRQNIQRLGSRRGERDNRDHGGSLSARTRDKQHKPFTHLSELSRESPREIEEHGDNALQTVKTQNRLYSSRLARAVVVSEEKTREKDRRLAQRQAKAESNAFEEAIASAGRRGRDRRFGNAIVERRAARVKQDGELASRYFAAHHNGLQDRIIRQTKRWQIQDERHPQQSSQWLSILRALNHATLDGKNNYMKRMETVRLPERVKAVFTGNTQSRILEVMQRTGSHVQLIMPKSKGTGRFEDGFKALTLWGLPEENANAIQLLPSLIQAVHEELHARNEDDRSQQPKYHELKYHELRSEVTGDAHNARSNSDEEAPYWRGEDGDQKGLEQAINDITYAPFKAATPLRAVWTRANVSAQPPSSQHVRTKSRNWTTLSFTAYVEDLTKPLPRQARRRTSQDADDSKTKGRIDKVVEELQSIFVDDRLAPHISSESLNNALQFLIHHRATPAIKQILVRLQDSDTYKLTTSNFDILLGYAALQGDVHNFRYLLRLMLDKGVNPSWRTWVRFHELVCRRFDSPDARAQVLEAMREKGILSNPQALRETATNVVAEELLTYITTPDTTIDEFIQLYDVKFGSNLPPDLSDHQRRWLSTSSANRMINCLLDLGRVNDALTVAERLMELHEGIGIDTVNLFLRSAYRKGDAEQASAALTALTPSLHSYPSTRRTKRVKLNEISYATLFQLAWAKRHYNILKVVWRYACMNGHVQWAMQEKIERSTLGYVPTLGPTSDHGAHGDRAFTSGNLWFGWAGKFSIGVRDDLRDGSEASTRPTQEIAGGESDVSAEGTKDSNGLRIQDAEPKDLRSQLTDHQMTILALSLQPRTVKKPSDIDETPDSTPSQSDEHNARRTELSKLQADDLTTAGKIEPIVPFHIKFEEAWHKDMNWRSRGLGLLSKENGLAEAAEDNNVQAFGRQFEVMLAESVDVPVRTVK